MPSNSSVPQDQGAFAIRSLFIEKTFLIVLSFELLLITKIRKGTKAAKIERKRV
jgi:hypothetical protein